MQGGCVCVFARRKQNKLKKELQQLRRRRAEPDGWFYGPF